MLRKLTIALVLSLMIIPYIEAQKPRKQMYTPNDPVSSKYKVDTRIDNMSYWRRMASLGLVPVQPDIKAPLGVYGSSKLVSKGIITDNSPDIPVTSQNSTQSENSVFINPLNNQSILNSNNSTPQPAQSIYGANSFLSTDAGNTWSGSTQGAGGSNSGDPATAISLSGRYYVGYIHSSGGQGISYSTDQGNTWTAVLVAPAPSGWGNMLDKNHLWIDNSPKSPYNGYLYDAWTNFGGNNNNQIEICKSSDEGLTWSARTNISSTVNAGSHNQGVNIQTGPNGEVYAIWAIYDSWPSDEKAIGFAKSLDGGATWLPGTRIIDNIRGIRNSGTHKNMRVNNFPTMAVDISQSINSGAIYVTWTNIGIPGINSGNDMDIYMIKSTDQGATWTTPVKVNQDAAGAGKQHFFPWITCDPVTGNLSVIYYDDRNVSSTKCEVYTSNSTDGGATWWDLKVSDVSFTPTPIGGLADGYFGDYLGNHARDGWVYPVWTDNRTGIAMTYISPYVTGPPPNQPWLVYDAVSLNDAAGNSNGLLDYDETALINVSIENQGDRNALSVNATLSTDNPYVTITDNQEPYGDILIDATVNVNDAFGITVAKNIPDGEDVIFTLTATDINDSTYVSNFTLQAHAPGFKTGLILLTDFAGNGNGRLDADETANIRITTINSGDYTVNDVTGLLTCTSPYITITNPSIDLGNLDPGPFHAVFADFGIHVSPEAIIGDVAHFTYTINSDNYQGVKNFSFPIGLLLEDWESGGFSSFSWQFDGTSTWSITSQGTFEGQYSARSGIIGNNATSELKLNYNVMHNDSISFFVKVSSEKDYDFLKFYVNNTLLGQWSGSTDWQRVVFPVSAGQNNFKWVYAKDAADLGDSDAAWIDYIILPELLQTTAFAGSDDVTCSNTGYLMNGSANHSVSTLWSTSGDGTFDNPASLNCFYTPGINDAQIGTVALTLTVNGPAGELKTDQMILTISKQAGISPIDGITVCAGTFVEITSVATDFTSVNWATSGTGIFTDPAALITTYQPSPEDIAAGKVTLSVSIGSDAPCGPVSTSVDVTILPLPTATIAGSSSICTGESTSTEIILTGTAPWTLEISNGIGTIQTSDNPYSLTLTPASSLDYEVVSVSSANSCQNTGSGIYSVTVNELPVVTVSSDTTICADHSVAVIAESQDDVSYLWSPGNQTSSFITVDSTGYGLGIQPISVLVTNNQTNCQSSAQTSVTIEDCTGIDETTSSELSVYPNPSNGTFTLKLASNVLKKYNLELYDATNKLVYKQTNVPVNSAGSVTIHTSGLTAGIYTLYLKGEENVFSTKMVIKN